MIWLLTMLLAGPADKAPARPVDAGKSMSMSALPATATAMLEAETRRIRTHNKRVMKLLSEGLRRSPTFADLVVKLHSTDVIVYIEPTFGLPPEMAGRILLQTVSGNQRYLRMQVRSTLQGDHMIAVIAHELRHALEVAAEPTVTNDAGLESLYRRIGRVSHGTNAFDTDDAVMVGRTVAIELIG